MKLDILFISHKWVTFKFLGDFYELFWGNLIFKDYILGLIKALSICKSDPYLRSLAWNEANSCMTSTTTLMLRSYVRKSGEYLRIYPKLYGMLNEW